MSYPVVGEIWSIFENALSLQARKLVEDIAKHQGADSKVLWAKIKPQIRIGVLDLDIPEGGNTLCKHASSKTEGAVKLRCRNPCLLGFQACPSHINEKLPPKNNLEEVDRIIDFESKSYFLDSKGIARDTNGKPAGIVENDTLYLFQKIET